MYVILLQVQLFWRMGGRFPSLMYLLVYFKHVFRAVSQDETLYPNANSFYPERFLNLDGTLTDDKVEYAFGYGRRYVLSFTTYVLLFVVDHSIGPVLENIWLEILQVITIPDVVPLMSFTDVVDGHFGAISL